MEDKIEIKSLDDYFALVRKRPAMYLGADSISKLHDHLQGYKMAMKINGNTNANDKLFVEKFNDFVCNYFDVEFTCGWKDVILDQCYNNESFALSKFFDLWDRFIGIEKEEIYHSRKIALSIFDEFVFNQEKMKQLLGDKFEITLNEIVDLFKGNLSKLKSDYDFICDEIKAENPELNEMAANFELKINVK